MEIEERPSPQVDMGILSRSAEVGVTKLFLQRNRSLSQAIGLAIVEHFSPAFARSLGKHLDTTLHPQFKEIVSALTPRTSFIGRKKKEDEAV